MKLIHIYSFLKINKEFSLLKFMRLCLFHHLYLQIHMRNWSSILLKRSSFSLFLLLKCCFCRIPCATLIPLQVLLHLNNFINFFLAILYFHQFKFKQFNLYHFKVDVLIYQNNDSIVILLPRICSQERALLFYLIYLSYGLSCLDLHFLMK